MAIDMGKTTFFLTQRYDVPSGRVGKRFVTNLSSDIDGIIDRIWNAD